jgi:hypothetical protein
MYEGEWTGLACGSSGFPHTQKNLSEVVLFMLSIPTYNLK